MPPIIKLGLYPYLIAGRWPEDIWNTYNHHADAAGVDLQRGERTGIDGILADFRMVEPWMLDQTDVPLIIEQSQGGPNSFGKKVADWLERPHVSVIHHCTWQTDVSPRIHIGLGFGALTRLGPLRCMDVTTPRDIDVSFVGTTTFGSKRTHNHRQTMMAATVKLGHHVTEILGCDKMAGEERPLQLDAYFASLARAKIGLSPYGLGDCCHRDFEAILAGCVMVGPDRDSINTWPDIYRSGEMYEQCSEDYSDLPEVVDRVLSRWPMYNEWRIGNRAWLVEETQPWRVARRMRRTFEKCL